MSKQDALVVVFARNVFYRRLYYLTLSLLALVVVIIGILIFLLYFLLRNPTSPVYFATDKVGQLVPIVPLSTPNMSTDDMLKWATHAVESAYSYDYINYRQQIQDTEKYFTRYGWYNYMKALTAANAVLALTANKQVIIGQVIAAPTILKAGILAGTYAWQIQMPVLVTYRAPPYDDKSKYTNALVVTVIVQRQLILQSDHGLGISQFIAQDASTMPAPLSLSAPSS